MIHRQLWVAAAAAAIVATTPVAAQAPETSDLTAAIQLAVDRGEMLYNYDRAAWLGTDDFLGRHSDLMSQAGGYVVSGDQNRTELAFFDKSKAKAIYRATFVDEKLINGGTPTADRVELSPVEKRMISAKDKALEAFSRAEVALCADADPNLAAIPSIDPAGPITVYLMTPQTDLKSYPLGGHYSVEVSWDGTVGKVRRFTNSCVDMPLDQDPNGARPVGFFITHLLDPTPTELHVFTSLASKVPIVVATANKRTWSVQGNTIRSVGTN